VGACSAVILSPLSCSQIIINSVIAANVCPCVDFSVSYMHTYTVIRTVSGGSGPDLPCFYVTAVGRERVSAQRLRDVQSAV